MIAGLMIAGQTAPTLRHTEGKHKLNGTRKKFLKDILVVEAGNLFVLLSSVMVGLVVPKLMGVVNYGYYQIFTL